MFNKKILVLSTMLAFNTNLLASESFKRLSSEYELKNVSHENVINLPAIDKKSRREKAVKSKSKVLNFAEKHEYKLTTQNIGEWQNLDSIDGEAFLVWRLQINAINAESINLGFKTFFLPEGATLFFYDLEGNKLLEPLNHEANEEHGQHWTPVMKSQSVIVELNIPAEKVDLLKLELNDINQAFFDLEHLDAQVNELKSGSCNVDVACSDANGWKDQVRSVARISVGGAGLCTGTLIKNASGPTRPYFLTANHCGINLETAPATVFYWNYQYPTCRTPGSNQSGLHPSDNPNSVPTNTGAFFRASFADSDVTLIELDDKVNPSANAYLAGWDRREAAPLSAVGIHHPSGHHKRISKENDPLSRASYAGSAYETHLEVSGWDLGTTEQGSSGSGLFSPERRIVGQLHGGQASCQNSNKPDYYGHFFVSWSNANLGLYLDPLNTGVDVTDGVDDSPQVEPYTLNAKMRSFYRLIGGQDKTIPFSISGGMPPYSVEIDSASLPSGLTFDSSAISGTPNVSGEYESRVRITDSANVTIELVTKFLVTATEADINKAVEFNPKNGWVLDPYYSFVVVTDNTSDNIDAIASTTTKHEASAVIETAFPETGTLLFNWSVDSEKGYDFFRVYKKGIKVKEISGKVNWAEVKIEITEPNTTIRWSYEKDNVASEGRDKGWLDQIKFISDSAPNPTMLFSDSFE